MLSHASIRNKSFKKDKQVFFILKERFYLKIKPVRQNFHRRIKTCVWMCVCVCGYVCVSGWMCVCVCVCVNVRVCMWVWVCESVCKTSRERESNKLSLLFFFLVVVHFYSLKDNPQIWVFADSQFLTKE